MKPTILELAHRRPVILDGAMTPVFQQLKFPEGHHTGEWSLEHPDRVQRIHTLYWEAGADAISTNTPPANRLQLQAFGHGMEAKHDEINRKSAELALEVCPPDKYVFGDIGPTGKLFKPYDDTPIEAAEQAFADQAGILADSGVDFLLFETFYNTEEALAALRGAQSASKNMIIALTASFQWQPRRKSWFSMMGDTVEAFMAKIKNDADILGVNCMPSTDMTQIVPLVRATTTKPLIARPNAGKPDIKHGVAAHPITPSEFAKDLQATRPLGIQIFGGCCGTNPYHIQALRHSLLGDIPEPPSGEFIIANP